MKGLIFDIQRGSFVDGEGVRTAVFFKGCDLRCRWCHNPEGWERTAELLKNNSKCTRCGKCHEICPNKENECALCGKCATLCPQNALEVCGKEYGAEELLEIIERDRDYYDETDGGVTFTGGECMLQIDFLEEILRMCKARGIDTAVDTSGNAPWWYFDRIRPYVDTFLYDIKCINPELHREFTGISNNLILQSLEFLCECNEHVVVRVPVIGGFNADEKNMQEIFAYLKDKKISRVELLPYHELGEHKYEELGLTSGDFTVPTKEQMKKFNEMLGEII